MQIMYTIGNDPYLYTFLGSEKKWHEFLNKWESADITEVYRTTVFSV